MEVLKDKHPDLRTPALANIDWTYFEEYAEDLNVINMDILE